MVFIEIYRYPNKLEYLQILFNFNFFRYLLHTFQEFTSVEVHGDQNFVKIFEMLDFYFALFSSLYYATLSVLVPSAVFFSYLYSLTAASNF